ncbi:MAG: phosphonate ABC transporter ATP-binding protein [Eubacteriales bacterium]|nr:phosphonate ABC transporter ATP-binding protein [Eubacteriales bacterium]
MKAIRALNLKKAYTKNMVAVDDITFSVEKGSFTSIIGRSGAGKTTLIKILNGSVTPSSGEIWIGDTPLHNLKGRRRRVCQRHIGTIYQDFCLVDNLNCMNNVLNAILTEMSVVNVIVGKFSQENKDKARESLKLVGLEDKENEMAGCLSGGQKQRVAIARAIMQNPDVILADEPVASLDPYTAGQILELLKDLQQNRGITIVMNSHNVEQALKFSDMIIGVKDGKVCLNKKAEDVTRDDIDIVYGTVD